MLHAPLIPDTRYLSPHTELHLLKKALKVVSEGQIWIDNSSVKAVLHDKGIVSQRGTAGGISTREQEVIDCVCQGLRNSEIARSSSSHPIR